MKIIKKYFVYLLFYFGHHHPPHMAVMICRESQNASNAKLLSFPIYFKTVVGTPVTVGN